MAEAAAAEDATVATAKLAVREPPRCCGWVVRVVPVLHTEAILAMMRACTQKGMGYGEMDDEDQIHAAKSGLQTDSNNMCQVDSIIEKGGH